MEVAISRKIVSFLCIIHLLLLPASSRGMARVESDYYPKKYFPGPTYPVINLPLQRPSQHINSIPAQSKIVFPFPEDVVNGNYLPNLDFLTDLALLFLPRDLPASGMVRLSRDIFESDQCVQKVSCEMTKIAGRHQSLEWIHNFLQDFPFQGDVADRLRQGSMDAITKLTERLTPGNGTDSENNNKIEGRTWKDEEICTFSCHPIGSLSKGLKILTLLHDLVRTVK